jgi:hypothetical protein
LQIVITSTRNRYLSTFLCLNVALTDNRVLSARISSMLRVCWLIWRVTTMSEVVSLKLLLWESTWGKSKKVKYEKGYFSNLLDIPHVFAYCFWNLNLGHLNYVILLCIHCS